MLLIGHHYTRYIGDLSGGQILKGIAEKALTLPEGEGLHFYDFDKIEDAKEYKNEYRASLDALELDQSQIDAIIAEANYAFKLNMNMFDEIQGSARKSLWVMFTNWIGGIFK
jgi:heme oxygenase